MWELSSRSAVTRCEYERSGLLLARHSGIFGKPEADVIVPALARSYATGLIEYYDGAVLVFTEAAKAPNYRVPEVPWCIIVRPDQYQQATEFCAFLATVGVMRTAWLREHAHLAIQWAQVQAEAKSMAQGKRLEVVSQRGTPSNDAPRGSLSTQCRAAVLRTRALAAPVERL
jgi:hypothetical protein